jgi:hypothetical protein
MIARSKNRPCSRIGKLPSEMSVREKFLKVFKKNYNGLQNLILLASPKIGATTFSIATLSTMTFSITINAQHNGTQYRMLLRSVSFMLSVANKHIVLSVIILNVIRLSTVAP